jgi:hypothetical protein
VTTKAVCVSGRPYIWPSAGPAKLCMAASAAVLQKKKEKHSQTEGRRRKASGCSGNAPAACDGLCQAPRRSSIACRPTTRIASTSSAQAPAARQAMRQLPLAVCTPIRNTGAAAQPRLPEMPCTEKAWPRRGCDTRLFSTVKSAGWNGQLPSPARQAASISVQKPCATDAAAAATAKQPSAANSTGRAPMRSTTKPAKACPMPEITKKLVTSKPSSE